MSPKHLPQKVLTKDESSQTCSSEKKVDSTNSTSLYKNHFAWLDVRQTFLKWNDTNRQQSKAYGRRESELSGKACYVPVMYNDQIREHSFSSHMPASPVFAERV